MGGLATSSWSRLRGALLDIVHAYRQLTARRLFGLALWLNPQLMNKIVEDVFAAFDQPNSNRKAPDQ